MLSDFRNSSMYVGVTSVLPISKNATWSDRIDGAYFTLSTEEANIVYLWVRRTTTLQEKIRDNSGYGRDRASWRNETQPWWNSSIRDRCVILYHSKWVSKFNRVSVSNHWPERLGFSPSGTRVGTYRGHYHQNWLGIGDLRLTWTVGFYRKAGSHSASKHKGRVAVFTWRTIWI